MTGRRRYTARTDRPAPAMVGWECVHIAIDDATRLAYAEVLPREGADGGRLPAPRDRASFAATGSRSSG